MLNIPLQEQEPASNESRLDYADNQYTLAGARVGIIKPSPTTLLDAVWVCLANPRTG